MNLQLTNRLDWLASELLGSACFQLQFYWRQMQATASPLYVGPCDLNSGLNACMAFNPSTKPSPHLPAHEILLSYSPHASWFMFHSGCLVSPGNAGEQSCSVTKSSWMALEEADALGPLSVRH